MASNRDRIEETLLDLAWGQWTEAGVPGTVQAASDTFIDLEALILLTSELAAIDPRLLDQAVGWLSRFDRYVSRSRIGRLARRLEDRRSLDRFLATLTVAGRGRWPSVDAEPMSVRAGDRARLADLRRPALLQLRMRAIFGVSARAEILRVLGWQTSGWMRSADIAYLAGYTKRNVDDELDGLNAAGLVEVTYSGNRMLSRLAAPTLLAEFAGPAPDRFVDWGTAVPVFVELLAMHRRWAGSDPRVRDVEASRLIDQSEVRHELTDLPALPEIGPRAWERLSEWAIAIIRPRTQTSRSER